MNALILVILTACITAVVTLLIARRWLFPQSIGPMVLNSKEQKVLEGKLKALEAASDDNILMPERYSEQAGDRTVYLTQREINAIIAREPKLADRARVHLSKDLISAGVLISVPKDMPVMAGKTIKVATGIQVRCTNGRPHITVEGVSLMGVPLPSFFLGGIKGRDLLQQNSAYAGSLRKLFGNGIKDLRVEKGRLRVELAD
ncbi:MAG: hypothetical protein R6V55_10880 [Desulfovermiculus sp.]